MLITSEDLDRLLSPCHKLQSLKLRHCNELVDVNISSLSARLKPQLRFLAVKQCFSVRTIDVSDSAVTSLQFVGYKRTKSSLLFGEGAPRGFPNITTASIHVYCKIEAAAELRLFEPTRLAHVLPKLEDLFLSFTWPVEVTQTLPLDPVVTISIILYDHTKSRVTLKYLIPACRWWSSQPRAAFSAI